MQSPPAPDNQDCSSPPASSSRNHRLRSGRRRKKSLDDEEQASRRLQLFHAHLAHSLDSIMEDPDHEDGQAEMMVSILPIRRMRKAQTESSLCQLDSSEPHTFAHRFPETKLENETDEWDFGIDEMMNMPLDDGGSKP